NEPPYVLRQQPNRADDPLQLTQFSGVVTARTSLDDETVHEAAIEPDTHPHACLGVLVHLGRNLVVEETVEVWHPNQRQHPGDPARLASRTGRERFTIAGDGRGWLCGRVHELQASRR